MNAKLPQKSPELEAARKAYKLGDWADAQKFYQQAYSRAHEAGDTATRDHCQERITDCAEKIRTGVKLAGYIDLTPTWSAMRLVIAEGASRGDSGALEELSRMAELADRTVAASKEVGTKVSVTTEACVRFSVPEHYTSGPEFDNFAEAVAYARKTPGRSCVAMRQHWTVPGENGSRDSEILRWEVYPDRVVLVPKGQGGLSDEQAEAAKACHLPKPIGTFA